MVTWQCDFLERHVNDACHTRCQVICVQQHVCRCCSKWATCDPWYQLSSLILPSKVDQVQEIHPAAFSRVVSARDHKPRYFLPRSSHSPTRMPPPARFWKFSGSATDLTWRQAILIGPVGSEILRSRSKSASRCCLLMLCRAVRPEMLQLSNTVHAGVLDRCPTICASVRPAAGMLLWLQRVSCVHLTPLHFRCRNRWGDPSVKTFVCELQIHHQVSDAARRDLCVRFSVTYPPQEMLPSNVLKFWLEKPPKYLNEAALKNYETLADEFHQRYVAKRDKLAS